MTHSAMYNQQDCQIHLNKRSSMKGKIIQWNDDRGFGFISVKDENERIFFHISSVKTRSRRPEIGDFVEFNIGEDPTGKPRAKSVAISSLAKRNSTQHPASKVDPPRRNAFDYLLIMVTLLFGGYCGYSYLQTQDIMRIWPYLVPAAISFALLGRNKKPAQESFSCAKCKAEEKFGPRTLAAWNRGMTRLFCGDCHNSWRKDQPRSRGNYTTGRAGCLGMLLVLALPPVILGTAVYQLLT